MQLNHRPKQRQTVNKQRRGTQGENILELRDKDYNGKIEKNLNILEKTH